MYNIRHKEVQNLILDYDGVIKYKNKHFTKKAQEVLFKYLDQRLRNHKDFVIHLNSLRGRSLFNEDLIKSLVDRYQTKCEIIFSGCNGSFIFDLGKDTVVKVFSYLNIEVIKKVLDNSVLDDIIESSNQNDILLYKEYLVELEEKYQKLVKLKPRLYWDVGYANSGKLFKLSIDIPENRIVQNFIRAIEQSNIKIELNITRGILEVTPNNCSKKRPMLFLLKKDMYADGGIIIIGDNPNGADREMLTAFEGCDVGGRKYFSIPNGDKLSNEIDLVKKFEMILKI